MFALVLGAASCAQDSTPSGSKPSVTEPSGNESSGSDTNDATDNNNTTPGGTQNSTPSGNKPSGSDTNDATDNNNTTSGGTQNSTPSGSKPSVNKPSVTKPEGTDIKNVIDTIDFNATWKLTDAYYYEHYDYDGYGYDKKYTTPEEVKNYIPLSEWGLDDDLCGKLSKDYLKKRAAESEELQEPTLDGCLKVNDAKDEIYYYLYTLTYNGLGTMELSLTFTKQQ